MEREPEYSTEEAIEKAEARDEAWQAEYAPDVEGEPISLAELAKWEKWAGERMDKLDAGHSINERAVANFALSRLHYVIGVIRKERKEKAK